MSILCLSQSATRQRILVSIRQVKALFAEGKEFNIDLKAMTIGAEKILSELKERERRLSFEGAEASFELQMRKRWDEKALF